MYELGQRVRRSREGAWIEMHQSRVLVLPMVVAPARERGLKSAFNEFKANGQNVAPARERGLKSESKKI